MSTLQRLREEVQALESENNELLNDLQGYYDDSMIDIPSLMKKLYNNDKNFEISKEEKSLLLESFDSNEKTEGPFPNFEFLENELKMNPTIQKFLSKNDKKKRQRLNNDKEEIIEQFKQKELSDSIIKENIIRLFGITAFFVNNLDNLNKNVNKKDYTKNYLLGIRFETFNQLTKTFNSPEYIILKRNPKNDQLKIFKNTIPVFLKINEIEKKFLNKSLIKFCQKVYTMLSLFNFKKTILLKMNEDHLKIIDTNLSFTKITIIFLKKFKIQLILNLNKIIKIFFLSNNLSIEKKMIVEVKLLGDLINLEKSSKEIKSLLNENT